MMKQIVSAACGVWLCAATGVVAQSSQGVLVELYTSQGCSSCPPADELLGQLTRQSGVIPLALHVDYWDYIGWADTFADPKFTLRQKAYAQAAGDKMIYTPQMVIGGQERIVGGNAGEVAAAIAEVAADQGQVSLSIERVGDRLIIRAEAVPPLTAGTVVQLVRFINGKTVAIERGENAGLRQAYHNIVTSWQVVGDWSGKAPLEMTVKAPGDLPSVVIVQRTGAGTVLAAARIE